MSSISIIICAHNTKPELLARCLDAVAGVVASMPNAAEVVLVDNASEPPLETLACVESYFTGGANRRVVCEARPGLTHARLAGFAASCGDAIVFVDDDNLLEPDYLRAANAVLRRFPHVAAWGPGVIEVVWEDGIPRWRQAWAVCFQAKHRRRVEFGCVAGWPHFFPAGTGLIVRRPVLERYASEVACGQLTALDRLGKRVSGAGDAQIVWTAIKMGLCAGISPELRLKHFTERRKATLGYVTRMSFGVMASGQYALSEAFPECRESMIAGLPSRAGVYVLVLLELGKMLFLCRLRSGPVALASFLGDLYGRYQAATQKPPLPLRLAAKLLQYA